jgi:hypothetical protein
VAAAVLVITAQLVLLVTAAAVLETGPRAPQTQAVAAAAELLRQLVMAVQELLL